MHRRKHQRPGREADGSIDSPAIGTCTARVNPIAFLMLSKIRRPRLMARDDRREIIVEQHQRGRFARHVGAALPHGDADMRGLQRRCVVLTPSPVIATISPLAFNA